MTGCVGRLSADLADALHDMENSVQVKGLPAWSRNSTEMYRLRPLILRRFFWSIGPMTMLSTAIEPTGLMDGSSGFTAGS